MSATIAFYSTLGYNLMRNLIQPNSWTWYSRIDEYIIVGALPFKSMINFLKVENVGGVVCCTEEFELKAAYNAIQPEDWNVIGIKFHHVPMHDFTGSTSTDNIAKAVEFIEDIAAEGKTCYVHCKAGRTRSATIASCYLMKRHNYMPNVALEALRLKRPQVILRSEHWRSLNDYRRYLDDMLKRSASSGQYGAGASSDLLT